VLVTLPTKLIGESCASATQQLRALKVTAKCPTSAAVASTRTPTGLVAEVLYQTTRNPLSVPVGSSVVLALSTGPSSGGAPTTTTTVAVAGLRAVPNLVGMSPAQVNAAMRGVSMYYTTSGPGAGTTTWTSVVSQTPVAGTKEKAGFTVSLQVTTSTSAPTTTTTVAVAGLRAVPNLVGMSRAQVNAAMKSASLYYTTTGASAGTTTWTTVLSESPAAGTKVTAYSTVTLTVK
jgi:beta-lactam-binding protein with PASTA domain